MKSIIIVNLPGCQSRTFAHDSKSDKHAVILEEIFAMFNHGSGQECELFLKSGMRSLSVNDFVCVNSHWYQCRSVGWEEVTDEYVDELEKAVVEYPSFRLQGPYYALDQLMWSRRKPRA